MQTSEKFVPCIEKRIQAIRERGKELVGRELVASLRPRLFRREMGVVRR